MSGPTSLSYSYENTAYSTDSFNCDGGGVLNFEIVIKNNSDSDIYIITEEEIWLTDSNWENVEVPYFSLDGSGSPVAPGAYYAMQGVVAIPQTTSGDKIVTFRIRDYFGFINDVEQDSPIVSAHFEWSYLPKKNA